VVFPTLLASYGATTPSAADPTDSTGNVLVNVRLEQIN
jgi:hypothetical protein